MDEAATIEDLLKLEKIIASMPPEKARALRQLPALKEGFNQKWVPNPGPQTRAFYCEADELFYGGSAGGGKTELLLGLAVRSHYSSLLLRRTNKEASKFIKRLSEIIGTRDGWNGQLSTFNLPDGRIIETGGCQLEEDRQKYKGDPHDLIGFDEIGDFTETQYRFISAWNRSTRKGQRSRVVATGNPPTTVEGLWVLKYWGAWLDPSYKNPAKEGEIRYFTTINGEEVEMDGPGPHRIPGEEKPVWAKSRTFIRADLSDNPDLEESGYDKTLAALPDGLRQAYRDGRFDVVLRDDAMQVIPLAWIMAAQERWTKDGWRGNQMSAMGLDPAGGGGDPATLVWRHGGWFSEIQEVKGPDTADGSAMAGLVVKYRKDGAPIVIDVGGGYAGSVIERFKDNDIAYQRFDGSSKTGGRSKGSNLKFHNRRAEAYWRFREELDPDQEGGAAICLPPDSELRAELVAVRYKLGASGIVLESKDIIRDRLGRSPNKADAVVMAQSEGSKAAQKRMGRIGRSRPKAIVGYSRQKSRTRR